MANPQKNKKVPTKGARKKWEPLKEAKPVPLTPELVKGYPVRKSKSTSPTNFLVP